jgi:putative Mn2+ efflux pump MntP
MSVTTVLLLSLALSADAAAVAATRALGLLRLTLRHFVLVALWFGGAQAGMAMLGSLLGQRFGAALAAYDHWIAFVLLSALGLKMLQEARSSQAEAEAPAGLARGSAREPEIDAFAPRSMALLALATSIDALAVGVTLPLLGAPLAFTFTAIGVVTALMSGLGLWAGRRFGAALGARADAAGGLILIALGAKILIEHLMA